MMDYLQFFAANKDVLMVVVVVILVFREPLSKLIPAVIAQRFGIKPAEKPVEKPAEPPLPKNTLAEVDLESGGAVRSVSYHWFDMGLVDDSDRFCAWILKAVDRQRQRRERLTFNFIGLKSLNGRFVQGWKSAVLRILRENSIYIQVIFPLPQRTPQQLQSLREYMEDEIKDSGKSSIMIRSDERGFPPDEHLKTARLLGAAAGSEDDKTI